MRDVIVREFSWLDLLLARFKALFVPNGRVMFRVEPSPMAPDLTVMTLTIAQERCEQGVVHAIDYTNGKVVVLCDDIPLGLKLGPCKLSFYA